MAAARRTRVGQIEIEWEEAGAGDRPLVLVHGFTGSRDDWADVIGDLAERGRTVAPDLRGHGGSSKPRERADYSLEQLVADLAGFLDAEDIPACDLLGHSMGGMVALRLVLAQPERVASLVLMDTAPGAVPVLTPEIFELAVKIARDDGAGALVPLMRTPVYERPAASLRSEQEMGSERYWERIQRKLDVLDPEAFAALGAELSAQAGVTQRLGEIACTTTVLVGDQDETFLEPARTMAEAIPGADHVVIPDAAHQPQTENRSAWLAAMHTHLERARAGD